MFKSNLNPNNEEFKTNVSAMQALVDQLKERQALVSAGGGEKKQAKMRERDKLLPRERLELLLDTWHAVFGTNSAGCLGDVQ